MTETILPAQCHNLVAAEEPHSGRIDLCQEDA